MRLVLMGLAVTAGAFLGGCGLLGDSAFDLEVGDCFNPPTIQGDGVETVETRNCSDAHGAEVVFVGNIDGSDYPEQAVFDEYYQANCVPAFNAYTGLDFDTAVDYDLSAFRPSEETWGTGDREITCYALRADESSMTGSIRKQ